MNFPTYFRCRYMSKYHNFLPRVTMAHATLDKVPHRSSHGRIAGGRTTNDVSLHELIESLETLIIRWIWKKRSASSMKRQQRLQYWFYHHKRCISYYEWDFMGVLFFNQAPKSMAINKPPTLRILFYFSCFFWFIFKCRVLSSLIFIWLVLLRCPQICFSVFLCVSVRVCFFVAVAAQRMLKIYDYSTCSLLIHYLLVTVWTGRIAGLFLNRGETDKLPKKNFLKKTHRQR